MTSADAFRAWRARVHVRVCIPARSCTCPKEIGPEVIAEAREKAVRCHNDPRHPHRGPVEHCESPYDVICKAVWPT